MTPTIESPVPSGTGYQTQFQTQNIAPPNSIYFTTDDNLFFYVVPSVAVTLRIGIRYLLPTGEIKVGEFDITTVATRSPQVMIQDLGEGFILGINVFCLTAPLRRGQCWVKFVLQRGGINVQQLTQTICQGYVTEYTSLFWPSAQTDYEFSGHGNIRSISIGNPAAGADWSTTVPTGAIWQINSIRGLFTASASAGTRTSFLFITDGVNTIIEIPPAATVTTGNTGIFLWAPGLQTLASGNQSLQPVPFPLSLPAGYQILVQTVGILGADQWSQLQLGVEEWLQP